MAPRLELQALLVDLIGSNNVYFQPPPTLSMSYPCIVYSRDLARTSYADNIPYRNKTRYQLTVIDKNPDSEIVEKVSMLPMCTYIRFFAIQNLNHDIYHLYF